MSLVDMRAQLIAWQDSLGMADRGLSTIQGKFETFLTEVGRVREHELTQIGDHVSHDRADLPAEFNAGLDRARAEAIALFDLNLQVLEEELAELSSQATITRQRSIDAEQALHQRNLELDREEEELKERNERLWQEIKDYNNRIREMGRRFGFLKNVFSMRKLNRTRRRLLAEQADVGARIEQTRERWLDQDEQFRAREVDRQKRWVEQRTEIAARQTKLEYLQSARSRIILRSTLEQVLFSRTPELGETTDGDSPCPQCGQPNHPSYSFCRICARRLKEDRPDFAGSLAEIAELNHHHRQFGEGVKACQELIGLVRGLVSGLASFQNSVDTMIHTQTVHPVPELQIEMPTSCISYGKRFSRFAACVKMEKPRHPLEFVDRIRNEATADFAETNVREFFERMGQELSSQAEAQW